MHRAITQTPLQLGLAFLEKEAAEFVDTLLGVGCRQSVCRQETEECSLLHRPVSIP